MGRGVVGGDVGDKRVGVGGERELDTIAVIACVPITMRGTLTKALASFKRE